MEYSFGKTAAKHKDRRAIVIGAITDQGVVPNCTKVIISRDMNHSMFKEWLHDFHCIPCMQHAAEGRPLAMDKQHKS
ncbi:hypothetical protein Y032_0563g3507 [Ancylostoma ceylanicum]|uniref:Uncharacterized protein n=1 Tax=Ancylostoma ceylanicum TaxID=53326 RepID=A0A016WRG2_9BILA|nr:hypothetical protein Y032_0563g3507 [Ancylostoma ceylanicum]